MHSGSKYQIDMCHGPLFSKIVLFSVPLMFSYVMQMFFNTADLIVVGRFASADALAAVGSSSGLTSMLLNLFFGLSVGVNVLTARHIGAKDREKVTATVHTAAAVGLCGGIIMAVIGVLGSRWALRQMSTPENSWIRQRFTCRSTAPGSRFPWLIISAVPFCVRRATPGGRCSSW